MRVRQRACLHLPSSFTFFLIFGRARRVLIFGGRWGLGVAGVGACQSGYTRSGDSCLENAAKTSGQLSTAEVSGAAVAAVAFAGDRCQAVACMLPHVIAALLSIPYTCPQRPDYIAIHDVA